MIAANGVTARYLASKQLPSLRRVVRIPKRWDRIVELAAERGTTLPREPDSKALDQFLVAAKAADPLRFPDLSLSVIKLLGAGEYVIQLPGGSVAGHFGLAVKDYAHSTAPNRRYPDLITQRLLKAAVAGPARPYENDELEALAKHCTEAEDAAKKVERQIAKSAAAILLESRIGEQFDAIVTGASDKGTWVRLLQPPIEGRLERGFQGLDVGKRVRVKLIHTDVERGFHRLRTRLTTVTETRNRFDYDVAILGGGSAGYAAARTAAAAGLRTVVIESGAEVGGLCLLRGCMPTKALLYAAEVLHLVRHAEPWASVLKTLVLTSRK